MHKKKFYFGLDHMTSQSCLLTGFFEGDHDISQIFLPCFRIGVSVFERQYICWGVLTPPCMVELPYKTVIGDPQCQRCIFWQPENFDPFMKGSRKPALVYFF